MSTARAIPLKQWLNLVGPIFGDVGWVIRKLWRKVGGFHVMNFLAFLGCLCKVCGNVLKYESGLSESRSSWTN